MKLEVEIEATESGPAVVVAERLLCVDVELRRRADPAAIAEVQVEHVRVEVARRHRDAVHIGVVAAGQAAAVGQACIETARVLEVHTELRGPCIHRVGGNLIGKLSITYADVIILEADVRVHRELVRGLRLQAIAEQSRIVRLPLNQVGSVNKINRVLNKFEQENERRPSLEEIADKIDLPEDKIIDAMKVNGRHVSVDAPFIDGEDNSLLDVFPNADAPSADQQLVDESLRDEISRALGSLNERERAIVECFFGIGQPEMTLEEIGDKYGLTRERVRQIKEKAIRRLRHSTKNKMLKSYLGQ